MARISFKLTYRLMPSVLKTGIRPSNKWTPPNCNKWCWILVQNSGVWYLIDNDGVSVLAMWELALTMVHLQATWKFFPCEIRLHQMSRWKIFCHIWCCSISNLASGWGCMWCLGGPVILVMKAPCNSSDEGGALWCRM